jgi:hypothetical protein
VISLQDSRWRELRHAYGDASDIPPLLRAIAEDPTTSSHRDGPWFGLWSSLCHQGDIYPASFAAVPHVVEVLVSCPLTACFDFFLFPASVELARYRSQTTVPSDLEASYQESLAQIPAIAAAASQRDWTGPVGRSLVAAVAASKGLFSTAQLLLEIDEADDSEVMEWYFSR